MLLSIEQTNGITSQMTVSLKEKFITSHKMEHFFIATIVRTSDSTYLTIVWSLYVSPDDAGVFWIFTFHFCQFHFEIYVSELYRKINASTEWNISKCAIERVFSRLENNVWNLCSIDNHLEI